MTNKIAIFVEGRTELELVVRILEAMCGSRGVKITTLIQRNGQLHFLKIRGNDGTVAAMVANCSSDGQVKTQIVDRYQSLVDAGYTHIIGLRDLYPIEKHDFNRLVITMKAGLPNTPVPVEIVIAVNEVESWFIDELSHFQRIHNALTVTRIVASGFDIINTFGDAWDHPAEVLHEIYRLEGLSYRKRSSQIDRTINALDIDLLYCDAVKRSPSLKFFFSSVESSLGF